jgi:chain length determinant protein (polysaccharide antigen chain regulator)
MTEPATDQLDIFELIDNLLTQKWLIAGITFLFGVIGLAFAVILPNSYTAETRLVMPLSQDIKELNIDLVPTTLLKDQRIALTKFDEQLVFGFVRTNLSSLNQRRSFFDQELSQYFPVKSGQSRFDVFNKKFNAKLSIKFAETNINGQSLTITLNTPNAELSASALNAFVNYVLENTAQEFFTQINSVIETEIRKSNEEVNIKRIVAENRRLDRVAMLEEALVIASAMGLSQPSIENAANQLNMEYMRGKDALEAEIQVLINRKSDDPFIDGMRDLQEKLNYLNAINIDMNKVAVARIDNIAEVPTKQSRPGNLLLTFSAILLGFFVAIFIALIRLAIIKRQ